MCELIYRETTNENNQLKNGYLLFSLDQTKLLGYRCEFLQ